MRKIRLATFGVMLATATMPVHAQQAQPDKSAPGLTQFHINPPFNFNSDRWKDILTEFRSPCDDETNTDPDCLKYRQNKAAGPHPG